MEGRQKRIQKADPEYRKKVLTWQAVSILLCLALFHFVRSHLPDLLQWIFERPDQAESRLRAIWVGISVTGILVFCGCAWYLWRFSKKIDESGRFPPPGVRVLRDVQILEGDAARSRARLIRILVFLSFLTALLLALLLVLAAGGTLRG